MPELRPHNRWHPWTVILPRGGWVATYPTTNARIIVGIALAVGYFYTLIAFVIAGIVWPSIDLRPWQVDLLQGAGLFVLTLAAVSTAQFALKRATAKSTLQPTASETDTGEPVVPPKVATPQVPPQVTPQAVVPAEPHVWADGSDEGIL